MRFAAIILSTCFFLFPLYAKEPANLASLRQVVKQYYHDGSYFKDAKAVVARAKAFINTRFQTVSKPAIVLDIDETSLSNYTKMEARQFVGNQATIHQEILSGGSPAIEPMLSLYQDARKKGIAVFFVTGRTMSEKQATIANLKQAGYFKWTGLYMRPDHYGKHSIIPFKSNARREITSLGYTVIASIGDQESDIKGGYTLKGFKMPNPYYYVP